MISPWSWPAFVAACPWKHPRQRSRAQGAKIQVALANELSSTQHASGKNLPFRSRSAELDGFVWGWWEYWMDRRLSMYYIYIYTYLYSTWITARKEYRNSDHGPMLHEFQANYGYPHGPSQRTSLWDWIPEFDRHGRVISLGHQGCGGCWSLERGVWTRGPSLLLIDGLLTVIEIMIDSGHSRVHSRIG